MLLVCRFSKWLICKAIGLNSSDNISIEMFLVKFGLCVKMICCLVDQFFIRYIDGKYRSATAPLVLPSSHKCLQSFVAKSDAPLGPVSISDIEATSCHLTWKRPRASGGLSLIGYTVEKRELGLSKMWSRVCSQSSESSCTVANLRTGVEYEFRIFAENEIGLSDPLMVSETVVPKPPFYPPGAPKMPEVSNITPNSIDLSWEAPAVDGGSSITGYIVERRDGVFGRWTLVKNANHMETSCVLSNLIEKHEYEFRVIAENKGGPGKPSPPVEGVIPRDTKVCEAPVVELKMKPVAAKEDGSATFTCEIANCTEVKWLVAKYMVWFLETFFHQACPKFSNFL